jgi:hypothetical protein
MHYQRMGYLGQKLYRSGWRRALQGRHSTSLKQSFKHWLLSVFFYYRRGFREGSIQRVESCLSYR